MPTTENVVLAVNAGSSSIKFALYRIKGAKEECLFTGALEEMHTPAVKLHFSRPPDIKQQTVTLPGTDDDANALIHWLKEQPGFDQITMVGHRVVHGMAHTKPAAVTPKLIKELKSFIAYDPEHLPAEIRLIETFRKRLPKISQTACFDTAFHHTMPAIAYSVSIPEKYRKKGIRRYGFHGLSYQYLIEELTRLYKPKPLPDKIIIAHLGNGASLAAIRNGKSVDTSMGFTPSAGIPMSTRSGDLDPGIAAYLTGQEKLSAKAFNHLINHESGLIGLSGTSSNIKDLLDSRKTDDRAATAVDLFCYQISKYIGAYAAAMGGLDMVVFSGGIGEHLPENRAQICRDLAFLGIKIDAAKNKKNAAVISKGKVAVRVLPTNEALMIARLITRI